MSKINYSLLMEEEISKNKSLALKPSLLLHSCCAPCSSAPLEILCKSFDVTVLYYNPNIYPESEFVKRSEEQKRFCDEFLAEGKIKFVALPYDGEAFKKAAKGLENERELGKRCTECYRLRLERCARYARDNGFDYFTTTLSVSPLKDAARLNSIGAELAKEYAVRYLYSDFKKKDGYKRSCYLSEKFGIYRQDYCGCVYSMAERYMNSAKGFIFDVDGTLCDTMGFYETFLGEYIKSIGITARDDLREAIRGFTIGEAYKYIIKEYNITKPIDEVLADADRMFSDFYGMCAELKSGVREFLDYAREKGIKMCIATATDKKYIEFMLKHTGLDAYFEFIITSPEVGRGKQYPDIYNLAASRLGFEAKDIIVFEDAYHAVKTAALAGYRVVAVKDKYQMKFEEEILKYTDIYVDSMVDLIKRENL